MESLKLNGRAPALKAPAKRARKKPAGKKVAAEQLRTVSWAGIALTGLLSAGLNGMAHAEHAPAAWAGWALGVAVPALVLILGKVAGETVRKGKRLAAGLAAAAGISLLALSVYHCAESIGTLTGSSLALALPMAVAIDVGLVACEVALLKD